MVPNDSCDTAIVVTQGANPFSTKGATGATVHASPCGGQTQGTATIHNDIWYRFDAQSDGTVTVDTCGGANFDTRLAAFAGSCPELALVACNDDACGLASSMTFDVQCGDSYFVVVGGYGSDDVGTGVLTLAFEGPVPKSCPSDINGDGKTDATDVALLLGDWGESGVPADIDCGGVGASDLAILLGGWGTCPDGVEAGVQIENGIPVAYLKSGAGIELVAVSIDPETGLEDYTSQRVLGFTLQELEGLEDVGDPSLFSSVAASAAAKLWLTGIPEGELTQEQVKVISRQSQLFALLRDAILPLTLTDADACSCTTNGCTQSPDLWFESCCDTHDICYCLGGTIGDRIACDLELRDCIAESGPPLIASAVADIYYRGVRAFGWDFFSSAPSPRGACCLYGSQCQILTEEECYMFGGVFKAGVPCICPSGPYESECPGTAGRIATMGDRPQWQTGASLLLVILAIAGAIIRPTGLAASRGPRN
jgi:hypothetical protein